MKAASLLRRGALMLMEDAIALVREHDERVNDLTVHVRDAGPVFSVEDSLEASRLRELLVTSAKKLLANLTGEDPSEENVEEAIYG